MPKLVFIIDWNVWHPSKKIGAKLQLVRINSEKILEKILNFIPKFPEKFLKKFHDLELINYDKENGIIELNHWISEQEPISDAERARTYRERKASRNRHESVTQNRHAVKKSIVEDVPKHLRLYSDSSYSIDKREPTTEKVALGVSPSPSCSLRKDASKEKATYSEKKHVYDQAKEYSVKYNSSESLAMVAEIMRDLPSTQLVRRVSFAILQADFSYNGVLSPEKNLIIQFQKRALK